MLCGVPIFFVCCGVANGMIVEGYFGMLLMMIPTINRMPMLEVEEVLSILYEFDKSRYQKCL